MTTQALAERGVSRPIPGREPLPMLLSVFSVQHRFLGNFPAGFSSTSLLLIAILLILVPGLQAQEQKLQQVPAFGSLVDAAKIVQLEYVRITFSIQGDICVDIETSHWRGLSALFGMLEKETFLKELEVTDRQKRELDDVMKRFDDGAVSRQERASKISPDDRKAREQLERDSIASLERALTEMDDVLLPHQVQRAGQIAFRYSIRTSGLRPILSSAQVKTLLGLEVGGLEKIDGQQSAVLDFLGQECRTTCEEALTIWLEGLTPDQIDLLKLRWPAITGEHPEIDVLAHWLERDREKEDEEPDGLRMLVETPELVFLSDGSIGEQVFVDVAGGANNEVLKLNSTLHTIVEILSLPAFRENNSITDEQFANLSAIYDLAVVEQRGYRKEVEEMIAPLQGDERKKLLQNTRTVQLEFGAKALAEMRSQLSQAQWNAIEQVGLDRFRQYMGPQFDLLHGDLGRMIELNDKDKSRLIEQARKAVEFLKTEGRRIEEGAIDLAMAPLGEEPGNRIRYLLGEPLEKSNSAILLIRRQLCR
jgi:hypothetical protein